MRQEYLKIQVQKRIHRLMRSVCKLNLYTHSSGRINCNKLIDELNAFIVEMNNLTKFIESKQKNCKEWYYEHKDFQKGPMTLEEMRNFIGNDILPSGSSIRKEWVNTPKY